MQLQLTTAIGKTRKDGAAPVMQAAAEENVKASFVKEADHSQVAEEGVMDLQILLAVSSLYFTATTEEG